MGDALNTAPSHRDDRYSWYVAGVLALASAFAQLDRQIMGLLTEPVKADLGLSDLEVSLLQGLAFVLMHALMAFPMGWATDRLPRRTVLATGIMAWSLATAACGLAWSFASLFFARFAVGIGEAVLWPGAQSLVPDYFTAERLPKAFTIFQIGAYLGNGGAFAVGGLILTAAGGWTAQGVPLLGSLEPWQATFLLVAAPGPIVALLMLTVREPERRKNAALGDQAAQPESFAAFLRSSRAFLVSHLATVAASGTVVFGVVAWTPSLFVRSYGWTPAQIGLAYGSIAVLAGGLGTLVSAPLSRALTASGRADGAARANVMDMALGMPLAALFPLAPSPALALTGLAGFSFAVGISSTLMPVLLQLATPHAFRGRVGAIYVFASSAIGAALGPIAVAGVTDLVLGDPARLWQSLVLVAAAITPLAIVASVMSHRAFLALTASPTLATKLTNNISATIG